MALRAEEIPWNPKHLIALGILSKSGEKNPITAYRYKSKEVGRTRDALGAVGGICKCAWGTRRTGAAPGHIRVRTRNAARALAAAHARFVFALCTLSAGASVRTSISCITLTRERGSRTDGRC